MYTYDIFLKQLQLQILLNEYITPPPELVLHVAGWLVLVIGEEMMQRKKHGDSVVSSNDDDDDDGGSAKQKSFLQKPTHLLLGSRIRAAISHSKSSSSSASRQSSKSPEFCLPGVPVVLKLVILSFVGFAVLVVLTAKGRRSHWRYKNNALRSAHMPQPLLDRIKNSSSKVGGGSEWGSKSSSDKNMGVVIKSESSSDATQRMLAQSSRFVDSEKKLKQQLAQLLEKQDNEKKHKVNDLTDSVLGIKISTRYLGEDILPYPEAKRNEKEWEKKMEQRKKELATADEREWNNMIQQYDKVMEKHIQENEHVDHAVGALDEHEDTDQSIIGKFIAGEVAQENKETAIIRPPKASEQWPSPSEKAGADTTILLKPAFGSHRPLQDAILIFAEGYDLSIYLAFVESLKSTGYTGDLVISISNEEKLKPGVKEYLESHSKNSDTGVNVVAYEVNWSCFKQSGEAAAGSNEGINHCKMDNAFGDAKGNPISDPRAPRPVATARYELYWIWSLQYNKESWLMLIDARDVWFQLHPFKELEDRGKVSGELHLFGVSFF